MSTFRKAKQICSVCGKENEVVELSSSNSFGPIDLDTRPPEMERTDMLYNIQVCKKCGYVSYDLTEKVKIDEEFLKTAQYKKCDGIKFLSKFSEKFYRSYLICKKEKDNLGAFWSLMRCVWSTDDADDVNNSIDLRKKCIEIFDTLKLNKKTKHLYLIKIDLLRRSRQYDECKQLIKELKKDEDTLKEIYKYNPKDLIDKIINFQLSLCNKKDDKCYNIDKKLSKPGSAEVYRMKTKMCTSI